ncbi:hypothetical protein ACWCXH_06660 [Kitasatospora sp. NPDC001660]
MPSQLLDPLFAAIEAPAFTERHLADLVAGTTAAVRVPGFLSTDTCRVIGQALTRLPAFNTWFIAPEAGGETRLWRRRWQPEDEQHRISYGYRPPVTEGAQLLELAPATGDGLLFAPANYHAVAPSAGRRVALAFFLGLTTRGNLIAWS